MLTAVLKGVKTTSITGNEEVGINKIEFDSRKTGRGDMFVAIRGTEADGHDYISKAIQNGACVIVCDTLPAEINPGVTYVRVEDTGEALGRMASNFYHHPSAKLKLVGITGTNGKTTTATLLYELFRKLGHKAGLISTVAYRIDDEEIPSEHTTPDAVSLNRMLHEMVRQGCGYCFMEVSSHSLIQHRIDGLSFAGGLFTNLTQDHLDYHHTFAEYLKAKKLFFDNYLPKGTFALVNLDDRNGRVMVQNTKAAVKTYAVKSFADYRCKVVESHFDGMLLNIDAAEVWVQFIGRFNAYNLLGAYAVARELGVGKEEILLILSELKPVAGRFEYLSSPAGVTAIIDYAHTPDALGNVLATINQIRTGSQKIITVVGCGGNRDKGKRPLMARIAVENSDFVIFTTDNPRFEDPADILNDMTAGVDAPRYNGKYITVPDRREAIKTAVIMAKGVNGNNMPAGGKGNIILVAGKGHETYQEINGVKHPFDDKQEIRRSFGL